MAINAKQKKMMIELRNAGFTVVEPDKKTCLDCNRDLSTKERNFYKSSARMFSSDETLPICLKCLEKYYREYLKDTGDDKLSMYKLCQEVNMVWLESSWDGAINSKNTTWKEYFRITNSFRGNLTFMDSDKYISIIDGKENEEEKDGTYLKKKEKKEAILRWGSNWDEFDLYKLEEFYHNMKRANRIETPQDEDYLKKLAKLSVKIDEAIDQGESGKVKQLGDLYSKYMSDSKFRAMDMTDADKQGGIRTFGQIWEEVERPDFVPPWEKYAKFLNIPQDLIDKTIMHIENFTLRFNSAERMILPPLDTPKVGEIDE